MPRNLAAFIEKFTVLKSAPRELWVIYVAKVLEIVSYALVTSTVVLWLSSDLGLSDAAAGDTVAVDVTVLRPNAPPSVALLSPDEGFRTLEATPTFAWKRAVSRGSWAASSAAVRK